MRYVFDHDLHIHSHLSLCSRDPAQNNDAILAYAKENDLSTICLTDHYWDETVPASLNDFYKKQDYAHIAAALPLPQAEGIRFLFGVETDMDRFTTIGVSPENYDKFDFIIVPTTHLHMNGFTCRGDEDASERAKLWIDRFDALLGRDLPFEKIGVAHLTCGLMYSGHSFEVLDLISDAEMRRLFAKAAKRGVGIELNFNALNLTEESTPIVLRPYQIAKAEGCRFYFGSDAHHPKELAEEKVNAEKIIDLLDLTEDDKWILR